MKKPYENPALAVENLEAADCISTSIQSPTTTTTVVREYDDMNGWSDIIP